MTGGKRWDTMTDVIEWLESDEGIAWSRCRHGHIYGLIALKDLMPVPSDYNGSHCTEDMIWLW